MATRFYLSSTATSGVSPPYTVGAYNQTGAAVRKSLLFTRDGSAQAYSYYSVLAGDTCLMQQFTSEPISAGAITGTIAYSIRSATGGSLTNVSINVRVISADGSTVRGTLLSHASSNDSTIPGATTTSTYISNTLSSVTALAGDRLCIEFAATEQNDDDVGFTTYYGCPNGTDLAANSTDTSAKDGWIEFSQTITVNTAPYVANFGLLGLF